MPTYEYKCNQCGHIFEVFQTITAEPVKICPNCGGEVKRLIGAGAGPIFKGTGFYQTDYKNKPAEKKDINKPKAASKESDTKATKAAAEKRD